MLTQVTNGHSHIHTKKHIYKHIQTQTLTLQSSSPNFFNQSDSIYLSIYLSISVCSLSIYLSIYLSQFVHYLSIYLSQFVHYLSINVRLVLIYLSSGILNSFPLPKISNNTLSPPNSYTLLSKRVVVGQWRCRSIGGASCLLKCSKSTDCVTPLLFYSFLCLCRSLSVSLSLSLLSDLPSCSSSTHSIIIDFFPRRKPIVFLRKQQASLFFPTYVTAQLMSGSNRVWTTHTHTQRRFLETIMHSFIAYENIYIRNYSWPRRDTLSHLLVKMCTDTFSWKRTRTHARTHLYTCMMACTHSYKMHRCTGIIGGRRGGFKKNVTDVKVITHTKNRSGRQRKWKTKNQTRLIHGYSFMFIHISARDSTWHSLPVRREYIYIYIYIYICICNRHTFKFLNTLKEPNVLNEDLIQIWILLVKLCILRCVKSFTIFWYALVWGAFIT